MKRRRFTLFLDFNGITHPISLQIPTSLSELTSQGIYGSGPLFRRDNVLQVNRLIHKLDAQVVISSSWRLEFGWKPFKSLFMGRVIGQTPWLDHGLRYDEILLYLGQREIADSAFLILDDNGQQFPDNAPLYVTDSNTGLTTNDVDTILFRYCSELSQE